MSVEVKQVDRPKVVREVKALRAVNRKRAAESSRCHHVCHFQAQTPRGK